MEARFRTSFYSTVDEMGSFVIYLLLLSTLSVGLEGVMNRQQACSQICGGTRHPTFIPWASSGGLHGRVNDDGDLIPPPPNPGEIRTTGPIITTGGDDGFDIGPGAPDVGGGGGPDINGELNFHWNTKVGWNTTIKGSIEGGREHEQRIILDNGGYIYDKDYLKWQLGFETNPHITTDFGVNGGIKFGNVGGRRRRRRRAVGKRI